MFPLQKKIYSLEEVSEFLGTPVAQLQQWEKQFKSHFLFSTARGKDHYTERDMGLFREIKYLREETKFTIEGAKQALNRLELLNAERIENRRQLLQLRAFLVQITQNLK